MTGLRVCLPEEDSKNLFWHWLSLLRGWGSLKIAFLGKSQEAYNELNNEFETLLTSSYHKDFKGERDRIVKEVKKLLGVSKIKG